MEAARTAGGLVTVPVELEAILKFALGALIGVVAWFLKGTAADLKETTKLVQAMQVTQADHSVRLRFLEERASVVAAGRRNE